MSELIRGRIPDDGRCGVFQTEGRRFAVGVAGDIEVLIFAVADPGGHPCDIGPLASLNDREVEQLRDALTEWLDQPLPKAADS